jgi:hypothetical protein
MVWHLILRRNGRSIGAVSRAQFWLAKKHCPALQPEVRPLRFVGKTAGPFPPPRPEGAREILPLVPRIADKIAFGSCT